MIRDVQRESESGCIIPPDDETREEEQRSWTARGHWYLLITFYDLSCVFIQRHAAVEPRRRFIMFKLAADDQ